MLDPSTCPGFSSLGGAEHNFLDVLVQGAISMPLLAVPEAAARCFGPPPVPDVPVRVVGDLSSSPPPARQGLSLHWAASYTPSWLFFSPALIFAALSSRPSRQGSSAGVFPTLVNELR